MVLHCREHKEEAVGLLLHPQQQRENLMKYRPLVALALLLPGLASAGAPDTGKNREQLNFAAPKDWKITHQAQKNNPTTVEMIPEKETLENWTRKITVQIYQNSEKYRPESFIDEMAESAKKTCENVTIVPVRNDRQNGHAFSQKILVRTKPHDSGTNETIQIKAIKGDESFYVVQLADRTEKMSREEMLHWAVYLRDITVSQKAGGLTLVQSLSGKTIRYVPTPEMAVSFSPDRDARKSWEIQHTDGSAVGVIVELVPKGDSINAWKEMVEQQTAFTKASVRQFVDVWKAGLLKTDPQVEYKEATNADGSISVSYRSLKADEVGIRRFMKGGDGIYQLAYQVRPRSATQDALKTWSAILAEATLIPNPNKRK
jgi:hypothetical protein